jgi:hypothetical protein
LILHSTLQVLIILHLQEFGAAIVGVLRQAAIPRPGRDVGGLTA